MLIPYVIYGLVDPETHQIRYVGKSKSVATRRGYRRRSPVGRWLESLRIDGHKPFVVILESNSEEDWKARERYWIADLRDQGVPLLNVCRGGNGSHEYTSLPEEILRLLGTIPDTYVAAMVGLTRKAISYHRHSRGIPCAPMDTRRCSSTQFVLGATPPNRLERLDGVPDLGEVSDAEVAARLGVVRSTVRRRRVKLGVAVCRVRKGGRNTKLTEEQVREIRFTYKEMPRATMAAKFSINLSTLHRIIRGETWNHV